MSQTVRRLVAAAALSVGTVSVVAGCGVPLDDSPRAIDRSTTSTSSPPTVPPSQPGGEAQSLFYLDEDELIDVTIPAGDTPSVRDALAAVLGAPPQPLLTSIPEGTELLGFAIDGRTAVIDLSEQINDLEGERQTQAYAQLVFTALASGEADRVRFLVNGEEVQVPTDNGSLRIIGADDYDPPLNPR